MGVPDSSLFESRRRGRSRRECAAHEGRNTSIELIAVHDLIRLETNNATA